MYVNDGEKADIINDTLTSLGSYFRHLRDRNK